MTTIINLSSQQQTDQLIAFIRSGNEVIVRDGEQTIARITPMREKSLPSGQMQRVFDLLPEIMHMSDDFTAPLPDSFWLGEDASETEEQQP